MSSEARKSGAAFDYRWPAAAVLTLAFVIGVVPWLQFWRDSRELANLTTDVSVVSRQMQAIAEDTALPAVLVDREGPDGLDEIASQAWLNQSMLWEPIDSGRGRVVVPVDRIEWAYALDRELDDGVLNAGRLQLHPNGIVLMIGGAQGNP